MATKIWKEISDYFQPLDNYISLKLHPVMAKGLMRRHVFGFGLLAALAILIQIVQQVSLQNQRFYQHQHILYKAEQEALRDLSIQINRIAHPSRNNELKKSLGSATNSIKVFQNIGEQLRKPHLFPILITGKSQFLKQLDVTNKEQFEIQRNAYNIIQSITFNQKMNTHKAYLEQLAIASHSKKINALESSIDDRINANLSSMGTLELVFLIILLTTLLFEALFIFRPAIKQLVDALEARTKFLSTIGHEIRNPMNTILGMSRLIQDTKLTQQQKRYIDLLSSSSNNLMGLLNNLIDYSIVNSGKVSPEHQEIDLLAVVQSAIDLVIYKIDEKRLDFVFEIAMDTPLRIKSDAEIIQHILLNILGNAVKFTEAGGIKLNVSFEVKSGSGEMHFSISDSGIGISNDKLKEIFDFFQQEDSSILSKYGGSGLGLSICSELIRLVNGNIQVKSKKGSGSCFQFSIPIQKYSVERFESIFSSKKLVSQKVFIAAKSDAQENSITTLISQYGGSVTTTNQLENSAPAQNYGLAYFRENIFNMYIIEYDQFYYLIDILQGIQTESRRHLLSKVVVILRSTVSAGKIIELNSRGIKSFAYYPIKPLELVNAIDLIISHKKISKVKDNRNTAMQELRFELAKPIRALIVDDSKDNQFLMKNYLDGISNVIAFADNGIEALARFKNTSFDIVFMDILMPEMDGIEAVKHMRTWERENRRELTPIVAITAHNTEDDLQECKNAGFTAHFAKPLDLGDLQDFLRKTFGVKMKQSQDSFDEMNASWQQKLKEYLPTYYKQRHEDLKNLKEALKLEDWGIILAIGHKIKGNAATYGFPELGQAGADLEQTAASKNLTQANEKIAYIEEWLKKVEQA